MTNAAEDRKLFKLILAAIASESLSMADYRAALADLRDGNMIEILDQIIVTLSGATSPKETVASVKRSEVKTDKRKQRNGSVRGPDALLDDIKRRKVNRDRLNSIIKSLDSQFLNEIDKTDTIRELLNAFYKRSTERNWQLLSSIVNGNYETDPYLEGMSRS